MYDALSRSPGAPTPEQRHEMIAIAAYYLAERRDFAPGGAEADWFEAERLVDELIAARLLDRATGTPAAREGIRNALRFQAAN